MNAVLTVDSTISIKFGEMNDDYGVAWETTRKLIYSMVNFQKIQSLKKSLGNLLFLKAGNKTLKVFAFDDTETYRHIRFLFSVGVQSCRGGVHGYWRVVNENKGTKPFAFNKKKKKHWILFQI